MKKVWIGKRPVQQVRRDTAEGMEVCMGMSVADAPEYRSESMRIAAPVRLIAINCVAPAQTEAPHTGTGLCNRTAHCGKLRGSRMRDLG